MTQGSTHTEAVDQQAPAPFHRRSRFREYAQSIALALLMAFFIRAFIVQAFKIPSGSMEETLAIGDHLLVNKFIYGLNLPLFDHRILKTRDPQRGDVIVFEYPQDISRDFIKRVIGTPGDVVEIRDKKVYVNGTAYENAHEVFAEHDILPGDANPRDNFGPIRVPTDSYFVMGDNRDRSFDSRYWGFVKNDLIKGLAFMKYWSWDSANYKVRWRNIGKIID
jgi:signal peptidase I